MFFLVVCRSNQMQETVSYIHFIATPFSATTSMVTLKITINLKIYSSACCELLQQRAPLFDPWREQKFFFSNVQNIKLNLNLIGKSL